MKKGIEASIIALLLSVSVMPFIDFLVVEGNEGMAGDVGIALTLLVMSAYVLDTLKVRKDKIFNAVVLSIGFIIMGIVIANQSIFLNIGGSCCIIFVLVTMGAYIIDGIKQ